MRILTVLLMLACIALVAGCGILRGAGVTTDDVPVIKTLAVAEAQAELAENGVYMTEKELGEIADIILAAEATKLVADRLEANVSASNALRRAVGKYLPAVKNP